MKVFTKYFGYTNKETIEGGHSRNNALINEISRTNCKMHIIYPTNKFMRLFTGVAFLIKLWYYKKETLFIHYTFFRYVFTDTFICKKPIISFIISLLLKAERNNKIIIEVNDLPYEQAIDLELKLNKLNLFDSYLYKLKKINFVFASEHMRRYVVGKYGVPLKNTSVLINGAPHLMFSEENKASNEIKFVYAGSLNKGRQISLLLDTFSLLPVTLYLLGNDGDWLSDIIDRYNNIKYLGVMNEVDAQQFVSSCDMGIIPYDDSKFYYNLCFPTKASFYISAGIPFLSTNLEELKFQFSSDVAIFKPISDWHEYLKNEISKEEISKMKQNVRFISQYYEWSSLIQNWLSSK